MEHKAKKLVIITEKIIAEGVTEIIESCGATGYTITPAGGKGSRGVRSMHHDSYSDTHANVKIEVITSDAELADKIAGDVASKYFAHHSGITYAEDVEILRPQKFQKI